MSFCFNDYPLIRGVACCMEMSIKCVWVKEKN